MFKELFTESESPIPKIIKELEKIYPKDTWRRKTKFGNSYIQRNGTNIYDITHNDDFDYVINTIKGKIDV